MGSIGRSICASLLFVAPLSVALEIERAITSEVGFASTSHSDCMLYVTVTNNTDQLLVDLALYAEIELFDADGIFISHGSAFGEKNEVYLGSGASKVTKPNDSLLVDGRLKGGIGGELVCEEVKTVEFRLKKATCKDRRGESLDCNSLLDQRKTEYQMSEILNLNW